MVFEYILGARITDYMETHPYCIPIYNTYIYKVLGLGSGPPPPLLPRHLHKPWQRRFSLATMWLPAACIRHVLSKTFARLPQPLTINRVLVALQRL